MASSSAKWSEAASTCQDRQCGGGGGVAGDPDASANEKTAAKVRLAVLADLMVLAVLGKTAAIVRLAVLADWRSWGRPPPR